jgi:hypothetical protein
MTAERSTIEFRGALVIVDCWCGMRHAIPAALRDYQQRQHDEGGPVPDVYCPLGHAHVPAGESLAAKLRRDLDRAHAATARAIADRDQVDASLRATKGALTKAKRRAANGVCPCCHRTFANVARHVAAKHPAYVDETALGPR